MSAVAPWRHSWPVYAVLAATAFSLAGMVTAAFWYERISASPPLDALIAASFAAALFGAIGSLILANTRRNVMWMLPVALATTALLALLATVLSALATTGHPR